MNEHSFDNIFGSQLPDLADKNWDKLQGKLERFNLQRKLATMALALYGLAIFSGLMMGVLGIMYYKMAENTRKTKELEISLVASYQKKRPVNDTVHQKVMVFDTVYRTIFVTKKYNNNSENNTNRQVIDQENIYYQQPDHTNNQQILIVEREKFLNLRKINAKESIFDKMQIAKLNLIKIDSISNDTIKNAPKFSLKPNSVSIGFMSSYLVPSGNAFPVGDGIDFGLRTVLGYNNGKGQERWGVVLDIQKSKSFMKNEELVKGIFNLPPNIPQQIDAQTKGGNVKEVSSYQFGIGLRYNVLVNRNLQPYIGLNWSMQIPNAYEINYLVEDKVDQQLKRTPISYYNLKPIYNILGANVGINSKFSNRISGGLELYYQKQNVALIETPNVFGTRVSLNYHFGK